MNKRKKKQKRRKRLKSESRNTEYKEGNRMNEI